MLKDSHKSINKIVNEQVKQWLLSLAEKKKEQDHVKKNSSQEKYLPCLAISRQRGSGGWLIGKTVAQKLNYKLFDSAILNEIAQNLKISRTVLRTLDEKVITRMELWINRLFKNHYIEPSDFQQNLVQTVLTIAEHGGAVFIGRAAHAIIPADKCLRVRFVAPPEKRIANLKRELKLSTEEAKSDVIQKDRARETFVLNDFGVDVNDPTNFDLIINTEMYTCDDLSDYIVYWYKKRFGL